MSAEKLIAAHLRLASDDLREARVLAGIKGRNAPYLAEQAVEQLVLAIAQSEGIHYQRSKHHLLDQMITALPESNSFKVSLQKVAWLEAYATSYRYPKPSGRLPKVPSELAVDEALDRAETMLAMLIEHFGVDVASADQPAVRSDPPRFRSG